MPKVSFILPAYKRRFLQEAIASILAQTYHDFELIVVDDCSPEDLKSIVDEFRDGRMSYYRNEVNLGGKDLVAAWCRAMGYATGEWCVLASDDDVYHPDYLKEMVVLTEKYPQVDLVHCRNAEIDAKSNITSVGHGRAEYETGIQMLYSSSVLRCHQRMADLMFRRSTYDKFGIPQYPLAWYSDHALAVKYAWEKGAACSSRILFMFRNSGVNLSSSRPELVAAKIDAGLRFREQIAGLIKIARPTDGDDKIILPLVLAGVDAQVFGLIQSMLLSLPCRAFFTTINQSTMPALWKQRLKHTRILSWLNVRRYLPRWAGYRF